MTIRGISLSVASLLALLTATPHAQAAYIVTIEQVGNDVVATGSGSLDLTALGAPDRASWGAVLFGSGAGVWVGTDASVSVYYGGTGPTSFGSIARSNATSSTGTVTGIWGAAGVIDVPQGLYSAPPSPGPRPGAMRPSRASG